MEPTAAAQRLRDAGRAYVRERMRAGDDDVLAWALTGSAARGDATAASDLEVWALTQKSRPPISMVKDGIPVTCFFESEALLFDLTYLVTVEAEHLLIVEDPDGIFAEVRAFARDSLPTFRRLAHTQATLGLAQATRSVEAAQPNSLAHLAALREQGEAQVLLLALQHGLRCVPKVRAFDATFGEAAALDALAALDLHDDTSLLTLFQSHWNALDAFHVELTGAPLSLPLDATAMARKAEAGEGPDALRAARTFLERHVLRPVSQRASTADGMSFDDVVNTFPAPVSSMFTAIFGAPDQTSLKQRVSDCAAANTALHRRMHRS